MAKKYSRTPRGGVGVGEACKYVKKNLHFLPWNYNLSDQ